HELNFPFLIECNKPEDIFKMALEIHTRAARYAFLTFADLHASALADPKSIDSLGQVTIFIPELSLLTFAQQDCLLQYFEQSRSAEGPQFISGSTLPLQELKKFCKVMAPLLNHLTIGYLAMTKPFEVYKKENVLEFFYEGLLDRAQSLSPDATI